MATQVSIKDVRHVAALARLGLDEARAESLTRELNTILEHMEALSRVDTSGVAEAVAAQDGMRLRPDSGPPIPLAEPVSAFAPAARDGLLKVPRLSTHEQSGE